MNNYELYHFGVKGMKWGVRKKRYGNTIVERRRQKSDDLYDEAHEAERRGNVLKSIRLKNKADRRAERERSGMANIDDTIDSIKKVANRVTKKSERKDTNDKLINAAIKTAAKGAKVASKLALYSAIDDVFYGGVGKKIAKETIVQTGRAAVTAYVMSRGGYDIKWYDKQGRRVG